MAFTAITNKQPALGPCPCWLILFWERPALVSPCPVNRHPPRTSVSLFLIKPSSGSSGQFGWFRPPCALAGRAWLWWCVGFLRLGRAGTLYTARPVPWRGAALIGSAQLADLPPRFTTRRPIAAGPALMLSGNAPVPSARMEEAQWPWGALFLLRRSHLYRPRGGRCLRAKCTAAEGSTVDVWGVGQCCQ